MQIRSNISLAQYSTMGLGGTAAYLTDVTSRMEVLEALSWANTNNLPALMIGWGSNIIWRDEGFNGLILVNKIKKFEIFNEDQENTYLTVGGGEVWDNVVKQSVDLNLTGIEALSLIPGTAGAAPIQNIGAYGQDISQTLVSLEAYDLNLKDFVNISGAECEFQYRNSRFKSQDRGRFFITAITLHLIKGAIQPPFYSSLENYLSQNQIDTINPLVIRNAVSDIRRTKLPDPALIKNCGSFFANPIISQELYQQIAEVNTSIIPHWEMENNLIKISAAWLIEQVGFKNYHDNLTGMSTWPNQTLVLINEKATKTSDLILFREKIISAVKQKFNITLIQEPELLPTN